MIAERDLQGHWRRDWLRMGDHFDDATRVHWLQAGARYADIRIPLDRPRLSGTCLADQSPATLRSLMRAEAFAGTTEVSDGVCIWHRAVNWHGRPTGVDAGRMSLDDGALIERGVHAAYTERWLHEGGDVTARPVRLDGLTGVLVSDPSRFLLVTGRADAPPSDGLLAGLEAGHLPDGLAAQFAPPCLFGQWRGTEGIVTLSTNPFHEGQALLHQGGHRLRLRFVDLHGQETRANLNL